jgi:Zn-dependent protease
MRETWLLEALMMVIPLVLSLTVHEWAHAYSAYKLGDDTAARQGRLTLNPMAHIDPIGTLLLPLLNIPFGWAKPVPINPVRFTRKLSMSTGVAITAAAGPLSNVLLAVVCTVVRAVLWRLHVQNEALETLLWHTFAINVGLAVFNMLPIPPLDGSRVVDGLMPYRLRSSWERFGVYAPFVLVVVIVVNRQTHGALFSGPLQLATELMSPIVRAILRF